MADDETISTNEDTAVNTPVATLLTGDTDANGDTLTVTRRLGTRPAAPQSSTTTGPPEPAADDFVTLHAERQPVRFWSWPIRLCRV